ncbi:MAG: hypothetical protein MZU97_08275 [Bacillus subtilis]|nr:hypothetical protein [Bacillus subtilis]
MTTLVFVLAIGVWVNYGRIMRGQVLSVQGKHLHHRSQSRRCLAARNFDPPCAAQRFFAHYCGCQLSPWLPPFWQKPA